MHKNLFMIAGLLSLSLTGWWLQNDQTSNIPSLTGHPASLVQEKLTHYTPTADTMGPLTEALFRHHRSSTRPWMIWYWMHGAISKAGITADLDAMKAARIGGAYLMSIQDTTSSSLHNPPVRELSPEWWDMVHVAMQESKRRGLKLALPINNDFGLAGGPWITPQGAMQKLVWSKEYVKGGEMLGISLPQPETKEDYYKDIAVLAYPANSTQVFSDTVLIPKVTSSLPGAKVQFLAFDGGGKGSFKSDSACWIQYKYPQPFTCRSITIRTGGNNDQGHRLLVQVSNDGYDFTTITRLEPPRHEGQDTIEVITHAISAVSALYYRFVFDKTGPEPGTEKVDAAQWKRALQVSGIYLSDEPVINQYESKHAAIGRVSKKSTVQQLPDSVCVPLNAIVDLTDKTDADGKLNWHSPAGNWVIVRIGHTAIGRLRSASGVGLPCDQLNPEAVRWQFDKWYGEVVKRAGAALTKEVISLFQVDGGTYSSQNWSTVLPEEFKNGVGTISCPTCWP